MDKFAIGDEGPEITIDISYQDIGKYAGASGDYNEIHLDRKFATASGYDSEIAHGMLTAGLAGTMVHNWFGVNWIRSFSIQFQEVVYPGDTLTVSGEITDIDGSDITASIDVTNQDGTTVLSGTVFLKNGEGTDQNL